MESSVLPAWPDSRLWAVPVRRALLAPVVVRWRTAPSVPAILLLTLKAWQRARSAPLQPPQQMLEWMTSMTAIAQLVGWPRPPSVAELSPALTLVPPPHLHRPRVVSDFTVLSQRAQNAPNFLQLLLLGPQVFQNVCARVAGVQRCRAPAPTWIAGPKHRSERRALLRETGCAFQRLAMSSVVSLRLVNAEASAFGQTVTPPSQLRSTVTYGLHSAAIF